MESKCRVEGTTVRMWRLSGWKKVETWGRKGVRVSPLHLYPSPSPSLPTPWPAGLSAVSQPHTPRVVREQGPVLLQRSTLHLERSFLPASDP